VQETVSLKRIIINDPTTISPIMRSRVNRILAFKTSEIKQNNNYMNMKLYSFDSNEPPIIFNIASSERVGSFKDYFSK
jgi:hypothetical protein